MRRPITATLATGHEPSKKDAWTSCAVWYEGDALNHLWIPFSSASIGKNVRRTSVHTMAGMDSRLGNMWWCLGKELVDLIGWQNRNTAFGVSKEQDIIARLVSEHVASSNGEGCRAPVSKCVQGPWRVDWL